MYIIYPNFAVQAHMHSYTHVHLMHTAHLLTLRHKTESMQGDTSHLPAEDPPCTLDIFKNHVFTLLSQYIMYNTSSWQ